MAELTVRLPPNPPHTHTEAHTPLPCSIVVSFPGSQNFLSPVISKPLFPNLQVAATFELEQFGQNMPAFSYPHKDLF